MMRAGALVMIDALGFKGIWGRPDTKKNPDLVIDKLLDLKRSVNERIDLDFGGSRARAIADPGNLMGHCSLVFLSDTIVLGLATKSIEDLIVGIPESSYRGMTPDAKQRLDDSVGLLHSFIKSSLVPYSVPLKGGDFYDTYVVSPFDVESTVAQRNDLTESSFRRLMGRSMLK